MRRPIALLVLLVALAHDRAWSQAPLDDFLNALPMRNIGPFRQSAWITSIAVPNTPQHEHLYTIWAGTRSGGVWKTTNGGVTWDPVFDSEGVAAIGRPRRAVRWLYRDSRRRRTTPRSS